MKGLVRLAAGYILDFFRERVTADDFQGERVARVCVGRGVGERGLRAVQTVFPQAELRAFDGGTTLWQMRRLRCDAACVSMAGGGIRERLLGFLSGARHKLLIPSPDYLYRFGMRQGPGALLWAAVDRFVLAPLSLLWLAVAAVGVYCGGLAARAAAAERGIEPWRTERVLAIRLMPTTTFVRLLERLRRRFPTARVTALLGSREGEAEAADACHEVISASRGGALHLIRRLRKGDFDAAILAGGRDYGLGLTYLKAALLASLCRGTRRYQWQIGEELPGRRLRRAVLGNRRRRERRPGPVGRWLRRRRYAQEPTRGPKIAQVGITKACNYHCLFCPFHSPEAEQGHDDAELPRMSYQTFARLLGDLKRVGTRMIDVCGDGEPLMHPDAVEMIALARALGFDVTLATNAALLTEGRSRRLVDLGVRRMHVSFNAAADETYERLHYGAPPGTRRKIIARLRGMAEYAEAAGKRPIDVEFSAVLNRLNMHEVPAMVELAHEARAAWFMLILMGPVPGGEALLPRPEDWVLIRRDIERATEKARRLGVRTNLDAIRPGASAAGTRSVYERIPCHIGHEYALVLADGSVLFCCQCSRPLGSLNEDSFERIWYSEAYWHARREAMALPETGRALPGCECFTACSHVAVNLEVYRKLYGKRALRSVL